jgi:hypothetical protein
VSTIEIYNRTVTPISVSDNSVQSTVTNNNSAQQTVIYLDPIMPSSRIALFSYSNIQGNLTIFFYGTNEKNWTSDLYWKVMFNSCDKYGELYCWLLHVIYFVFILMTKHKFFIYSLFISVMAKIRDKQIITWPFHIGTGIIPWPISALGYRLVLIWNLGMIPGQILKRLCYNLYLWCYR